MRSLLPLFIAEQGYVPLRDPWPIETSWLLLMLPLVVCISIVYKTIKVRELTRLPVEAALMTVQIVAFMVLTAAGLWLLTELA